MKILLAFAAGVVCASLLYVVLAVLTHGPSVPPVDSARIHSYAQPDSEVMEVSPSVYDSIMALYKHPKVQVPK